MNALFTFEAAGRHLNFSRAADELNVTPAAVSRMIQRLEEHLGTALFHRTHAGLALNQNGAVLHEATTRAMSLIGTALTDVEQRIKNTDTVTLSVSTAFTTHWLMPRMDRFKAEFPTVDLRFQLVMGALTGPVHEVDLGMRFIAPDQIESCDQIIPIMPEVLIPLCSPAYRDDMHARSKDGYTVIQLSGDQSFPLHDLLEKPASSPSPSLLFDDYAIVVQATLLGQGVSWGWLNVVGHWMRQEQLVPAMMHKQIVDRICCMIQAEGHSQRPVVENVRNWIIEEMQGDYLALQSQYPELETPELSHANIYHLANMSTSD